MASSSRTSRVEIVPYEEALRRILDDENDTGGMTVDEESNLDHELYDLDGNYR